MSRIFVLVEDIKNFDVDDIYSFPNEFLLYELMKCYGIDYVSKETDFEDDIEWLQQTYNFKLQKIENNIYKIYKEELINAFKREKEKRLKKVKKLIKKAEIDLMSVSACDIANEIYMQKGFFFYFRGFGVINEMDLLEGLKLIKNDTLYIVASFEYHY